MPMLGMEIDLHAAGHHHVGAVVAHIVGGHADGLQARGAEAVHGHAGGGDRQAGQQARLARHVAAAVGARCP